MTPKKMCEGCVTYYVDGGNSPCRSVRHMPYIPETLLCPCSNCILKAMCSEPCVDFSNYVGIVPRSFLIGEVWFDDEKR